MILTLWSSPKNSIFGKTNKLGVNFLKRGASTACRFKRGLGKKEGLVFLKAG